MFARDRTNDTLHKSQAVAVVFAAVAFVVGVGVDARISAKQDMECVLHTQRQGKVSEKSKLSAWIVPPSPHVCGVIRLKLVKEKKRADESEHQTRAKK